MSQKQFHPTTSELPLLLDGRQNALVRLWKRQPDGNVKSVLQNADRPDLFMLDDERTWPCETSPFGTVNDILWCKERWWSDWKSFDEGETELCYAHEQAYGEIGVEWNAAISMPKSACRLWLQVLEVKVIRVSEVTEEMAIAAGFEDDDYDLPWDQTASENFRDSMRERVGADNYTDSLFVWYATVKRIEKP